jgi:tungstate transport system permease protein
MDLLIDSLRQAAQLLLGGDPYVRQVLLLSLRVSCLAVGLGMVVGLPVGTMVGTFRFPGRRLVITLIHTGFALPPVVVGLFVYLLLSRAGPAGGLHLLFTPSAMIFAQALLATPYIAGITLAAVQSVPADARRQARSLGASPLRSVLTHVAEARTGVVAAVIAGFGAVISEVGAVLLVGGNIRGETRVITTAIVLETRRGNFAVAIALGLVLLAVAFTVNLLLTQLQQKQAVRAGSGGRPWS